MSALPKTSSQAEALAIINAWVDDAESDGDCDVYSGKRRWSRYKWQVPVTLETLSDGIRHTCLYVTSRDVCSGGLGVWCNQLIEPGTMIRLSVDDADEFVDAEVRQCTETVGGFIIGLSFRT